MTDETAKKHPAYRVRVPTWDGVRCNPVVECYGIDQGYGLTAPLHGRDECERAIEAHRALVLQEAGSPYDLRLVELLQETREYIRDASEFEREVGDVPDDEEIAGPGLVDRLDSWLAEMISKNEAGPTDGVEPMRLTWQEQDVFLASLRRSVEKVPSFQPVSLCTCPATSEYDDPCPTHGVLGIGVTGDRADCYRQAAPEVLDGSAIGEAIAALTLARIESPAQDCDAYIAKALRILNRLARAPGEPAAEPQRRATCTTCGTAGQIEHGTPVCCECRLADADERLAELQFSFDLRWKADQRAIDRWRAAAPGRDLVRPDHADLCVWLLNGLAAAEARDVSVCVNLVEIDRAYVQRVVDGGAQYPEINRGVLVVLLRAIDAAISAVPVAAVPHADGDAEMVVALNESLVKYEAKIDGLCEALTGSEARGLALRTALEDIANVGHFHDGAEENAARECEARGNAQGSADAQLHRARGEVHKRYRDIARIALAHLEVKP